VRKTQFPDVEAARRISVFGHGPFRPCRAAAGGVPAAALNPARRKRRPSIKQKLRCARDGGESRFPGSATLAASTRIHFSVPHFSAMCLIQTRKSQKHGGQKYFNPGHPHGYAIPDENDFPSLYLDRDFSCFWCVLW
jgi:hypothetical protein